MNFPQCVVSFFQLKIVTKKYAQFNLSEKKNFSKEKEKKRYIICINHWIDQKQNFYALYLSFELILILI